MRFLYSTANIFCLLFLWRQMQQHTVCYLMNACHSAFWLSCLAAATNTNTKDDVLCSVDYSCTTACHRPLFATAQGDNRPPWPFTVGFVVQQKLSKFATVTLLEGSFDFRPKLLSWSLFDFALLWRSNCASSETHLYAQLLTLKA